MEKKSCSEHHLESTIITRKNGVVRFNFSQLRFAIKASLIIPIKKDMSLVGSGRGVDIHLL